KRSRAADDPKLTDLPWLEEVHSKIWNRKDLRPQLFLEVEVTQAHYTALQKRLKELHSDRDSPGYNGSKLDVLRVKLDFLRSLTPEEALSPRYHDDNDDRVDDDDDSEASDGDDPEIKSLFPSILHFLDLSTLELKEVPNRLPLPLLLRQEYKDISKLIEKEPKNNGGSVIVSGQPGTGLPFLYQTVEGTVYHVAEKGVDEVQSWSSEEPIVAFVDVGEADCKPNRILLRRLVQLIVASSPKGAYQKWTKQLGHASAVTKLVVKLWSHEELLLTGIFLHASDLSFKLLRESTSYFGYNPRRCFEASLSVANLESIKKEVESVIRGVSKKGIDYIIELLLDTQTGGSDVSYMIFQNFPTNTDTNQLLADCRFETVSRWALDLLLHALAEAKNGQTNKANVTADFYHNISVMPVAASLRGHLFEMQVLNHLRGICIECTFPIRGLTDSNQTWTYRGRIRHITFQESTVFNEISKAVRKRKPLHLIPFVRNFPAVDLILYDPDDPDAVVTCFQITMNKDHASIVSGLQRIQSWFKLGTPLEGLRPTGTRPWRFLFVVPSGMVSTFKSQNLDGDTRGREWAGKVHQYVLGLEEETIFGTRSDSSVQCAITSQEWE
ncbi:hypothetical protein F5888DRAFT_1604032, partial [Russula emetica]